MAKWQGDTWKLQLTVPFTLEQEDGYQTGATQRAFKRAFRKRWAELRNVSVQSRDYYRTGYIFWRNELAKVRV